MQKTLVSVATGSVLCLCLATVAGHTVAQGGGERAMELLDAVATARGLGSTPIKDGGGNPPVADDDGDGVANDSDSVRTHPRAKPWTARVARSPAGPRSGGPTGL